MTSKPTVREWWRKIFAADPVAPAGRRAVAVAALGMGVPVLLGWATGHIDAGLMIGLGAILLAGTPEETAAASAGRGRAIVAALPALLAVIVATLIAGRAWSDPTLIAIVAIAGLVSGYSRPLAVAAIRFIVYLVLSAGLLEEAATHQASAALIFGLGCLWNIALRSLLERKPGVIATPTGRVPTTAQRRAHFRKTLHTLAGWQFPVRLVVGLGVASAIRHAWPAHHYYWIVLTVALLTQRPLEHVPVKTVQRLLGTVAGVALTWIVVSGLSSTIALAVVICVLATVIPLARARSYLLYSIVATPLILLVLDLGKPIEVALLIDRLVATLIGGALVIAANVAADRWLLAEPRPGTGKRD